MAAVHAKEGLQFVKGLHAHTMPGGPLVDGGAHGRHSMYDLMTASAASALIALP